MVDSAFTRQLATTRFPARGPYWGNTEIYIKGSGFLPSEHMTIRFEANVSTLPKYGSSVGPAHIPALGSRQRVWSHRSQIYSAPLRVLAPMQTGGGCTWIGLCTSQCEPCTSLWMTFG